MRCGARLAVGAAACAPFLLIPLVRVPWLRQRAPRGGGAGSGGGGGGGRVRGLSGIGMGTSGSRCRGRLSGR